METALIEETLSVERLDANGGVRRPARMRFVSVDLRSRVLAVYADADKLSMLGWLQLAGCSLLTLVAAEGEDARPPYRWCVASPDRDKVFRMEASRLPVFGAWMRALRPCVARLPAPAVRPEDVAEHFSLSARVTGGYEDADERSEEPAFALECRARFTTRSGARRSVRWVAFATFPQFEAADAALRVDHGWQVDGVPFVRRHRRRRLFGFDRGADFLARRVGELNEYLEALCDRPRLWAFHHPTSSAALRELVAFDEWFGREIEATPSPRKTPTAIEKPPQSPARDPEAEARAAAAVTAAWASAEGIEPVRGREASDLRRVVFQSVLEELGGDEAQLRAFKRLLRAFWKERYSTESTEALGAFLRGRFQPAFRTWLVRDLARLIQEQEGREVLMQCARASEASVEEEEAEAEAESAPPPAPAAVSVAVRQQLTAHGAATKTEATILTLQDEVLGYVRLATGDNADELRRFRQETRRFGQGQSEAPEFYAYLRTLFDAPTLNAVLPTLVVLLRDPDKRMALQAQHL